ncbi:hypothetical protein [Botrimarina mediterranea]|uniref:hypothetical protein n=1 Tax=Botrimarina mediterranea TaxID=2528022 RepID=UPI00118C458B|nr:hypothetical protein K2D_27260 [Planctomycetes bacterium K2D]
MLSRGNQQNGEALVLPADRVDADGEDGAAACCGELGPQLRYATERIVIACHEGTSVV